jgi:uncharacterized protein YndB with AHSA1/START domain
MSDHESQVLECADNEVMITRLFDAPRELVWEAWTNLEHIAKWWGPNGFTTTTKSHDFRPGGLWVYTMHGPDGTDYPNEVKFIEIVRPERIIHSHGDGQREWFKSVSTFDVEGNQTRVTIKHMFPTADERNEVVLKYGAIEGGKQHLARLAELLTQIRKV